MYKEDVDDNKLFEYLWHLSLMLARKANFFNKTYYYEDFATYNATRIFFRIKNPKQFDDSSSMQKIKSSLNYLKATLYPSKVDFEQEHYSQVISYSNSDEEDVAFDVHYSFSDKLSESVDELTRVEFTQCLNDIITTFKWYLEKLPYNKNSVIWKNIYISCLLTILNSIVIDNKTYDRISSFKYKDLLKSIQDT